MLKGSGMTDLQRKRIFDALLGNVSAAPPEFIREAEDIAAKDVCVLEPIIDEFLLEAACTGQPKPC